MNVTRSLPHTSVPDVLDRVLDKGIVIDARVRVSVAGIELVGLDAQVVVASISTYNKFFQLAGVGPAAEGAPEAPAAIPMPATPRKRRLRRAAARRRHSGARCSLGCTFPSASLRAAPCPYGDGGICILKPA